MSQELRQYKSETESKVALDTYYFKYIFKKTEKIVCAVFYILNNKTKEERQNLVIKDVELWAKETHDIVLQSLTTRLHEVGENIDALVDRLMALDSKLLVLEASLHISHEHYVVFHNEIDSVIRSAYSYKNTHMAADPLLNTSDLGAGPFSGSRAAQQRQKSRVSRAESANTSVTTAPNTSDKKSRRERIEQVLLDKGAASIKDITEVVTDCSEKTIQRELNAMIKDGLVERKGERRWSTYSRI